MDIGRGNMCNGRESLKGSNSGKLDSGSDGLGTHEKKKVGVAQKNRRVEVTPESEHGNSISR